MSFSSIPFLFGFMPLFFLLYYLIPQRGRMVWILLGSLVFYGWSCREAPWQFFLLLILVLMHFGLGWFVAGRWGLLALGLFVDFGLLFLYKYFAFFVNALLSALGLPATLVAPAMPLGLSFFVFQGAAYLIDAYRGQLQETSLVRCGAFFLLFPHAASGPILRHDAMATQLSTPQVSLANVDRGLREFCIGLGLKVLLADRVGKLWQDAASIGYESLSTPLAWMALAAYSFQLYLDFYGYSRMAVGLGWMMGLELPRNFSYPYTAHSMTEFWRRWHMSLSQWFRDYLYIPLGGSRCGMGKTLRNLLIVWLTTGLWHGANWNFLLWGLVLFVLLALEKLGLRRPLEAVPFLGRLYMLLAIPLTWLVFGLSDLSSLHTYLCRLFAVGGDFWGPFAQDTWKYLGQYGLLLLLAALFSTPIPRRVYQRYAGRPWMALLLVAAFLFSFYCIYRGLSDPFLYFQF